MLENNSNNSKLHSRRN